MTKPLSPAKHLSNISQIILQGVQDIIGPNDIEIILDTTSLASEPTNSHNQEAKRISQELKAIQSKLISLYGTNGGKGVAMQAGRSTFNSFLQQYGHQMGVVDINHRLLPSPKRLESGLDNLTQTLSNLCGSPGTMFDRDNSWEWTISDCTFCTNQPDSEVISHFIIGLLQEYLYWASGGRFYQIYEDCQKHNNQQCVIRIHKQATA